MLGWRSIEKKLNIRCIKMKLKTKQDILNLIKKDKWMMNMLKIVKDLNLPDWWIGAGFVRNKVFDYLHEYKKRTKLNDTDIIYFDSKDLSEKTEENLQRKLKKKYSKVKWSVTNQARMWYWKNESGKPYKCAEDGLARFNETATCIGVKLDENKLVFTAPQGIRDLINLTIKLNPLSINHKEVYIKRLKTKKWKEKWPKLKIVST